MLVLFDHSTPAPLKRYLVEHTVREAVEQGWDRLSNGELLTEAENLGFEVLITADKNIRYQQNLAGRRIAIVELATPRWPLLKTHVEEIATVNSVKPGSYVVVEIPSAFSKRRSS